MSQVSSLYGTEMERPLGVTIIAVLQFFGTALLILVALALGTGNLRMTLGLTPVASVPRFALLADAGRLGATVMLLSACFLVALGYGMWKLRNWARMATIAVEAFGAVAAAFGLLWALTHVMVLALLFTSIRLGINLLILWYLYQRHVRQAFGLVLPGLATLED